MGVRLLKVNKELLGRAIFVALNPHSLLHEFEQWPKDTKITGINDEEKDLAILLESKEWDDYKNLTLKITKGYGEIPDYKIELLELKKGKKKKK